MTPHPVRFAARQAPVDSSGEELELFNDDLDRALQRVSLAVKEIKVEADPLATGRLNSGSESMFGDVAWSRFRGLSADSLECHTAGLPVHPVR